MTDKHYPEYVGRTARVLASKAGTASPSANVVMPGTAAREKLFWTAITVLSLNEKDHLNHFSLEEHESINRRALRCK